MHATKFPTPRRAPARLIGVLALLALSTGCERIKRQLNQEAEQTAGDPVWQGDSTFLASKPSIVFRVLPSAKGSTVVPIATMGSNGFRRLRLSPRGWRAFDIDYLHSGNHVDVVTLGRPGSTVPLSRGMWEAGAALDSLPGCNNLVPIGLAEGAGAAGLAVANGKPTLKPVTALSSGELQEALANVPTLIAPSSGIATSMLARYKREVYELPTGASSRPSILLVYNDPEQVSDTLRPIAQRPRQFIVVLDKGVYGYRPSYTYTTLGNALTPPRLTFLDMLDVDGDGKAELFFGFVFNKKYDATQVLRFDNDAWRESMKEPVRCQG